MAVGTGISGTTSRGRGYLSAKRVLGLVVVLGGTGGLVAASSCGGTTGRDNLPPVPGMDATADTSPITYADRELPDLGAPPSADGGEAGYPWPTCPPFLPVFCPSGFDCPLGSMVVEAGMEVDQEPATYDDAGNIVLALDASACADYGWFGGNTQIDHCVTANWQPPMPDYGAFPPCSWCAEAGPATGGPGVGYGKLQNCILLYECMESTGCARDPRGVSEGCLCGDASSANCTGSGPCGMAELAALERTSNAMGILDALKNFANTSMNDPGWCGGRLNTVYQTAQSNNCFVDASTY
jgi:hypothetical protein